MADEILRPRVVESAPFPDELESSGVGSVTQTSGGNSIPNTTKDQRFPRKFIAQEMIGPALNTKSRKILAEFDFEEKGALQIGKFVNGDSGDIKISPNGIVARDNTGATTFALDGTTGSAVFKGTLNAGTLIGGGGRVYIENVDGNGRIIVLDDQGIPRILIGYQLNGF